MRGFSLIESIVYLALFGLLMSSTVSAVAGMRVASTRTSTQALLLEEGMFVQETFDHADDVSSFHISHAVLMHDTSSETVPVTGNQVQISDLSITSVAAHMPEPGYSDIRFTLSVNTGDALITHTFSNRVYSKTP